MYEKSIVHRITKVLVDVLLYVGAFICLTLPLTVPAYVKFFSLNESIVIPAIIFLLVAGLCALYILWQLRVMFKTLVDGSPFISSNVTCLRKCAVASFVISVDFAIVDIVWFSITNSAVVIMFGLLSLFCLTLKDIFKQAIAYKEENDWTV
jgi:hypothetical protein